MWPWIRWEICLALKVTAANEQERAQVAELAAKIQEVTGGKVEIAFVDQGYTGEEAAQQAEQDGIQLGGRQAYRSQNEGLSCCRDVGSSNGPSDGSADFAAWHATTND